MTRQFSLIQHSLARLLGRLALRPTPPSPRDLAPVLPVALLVGVLVVVRVGLGVVARGLVTALVGQVSHGGGVASDLALAGLSLHPLGVVDHASARPEGRRKENVQGWDFFCSISSS